EVTLEDGSWPDVDFRKTVLLNGIAPERPPRGPGTTSIISYANTRIEIEADSPVADHVVPYDAAHPWWTAEIDGRRVPVLRANVIFRAVAVPPGRHRVIFTFRPVEGAIRELRQH